MRDDTRRPGRRDDQHSRSDGGRFDAVLPNGPPPRASYGPPNTPRPPYGGPPSQPARARDWPDAFAEETRYLPQMGSAPRAAAREWADERDDDVYGNPYAAPGVSRGRSRRTHTGATKATNWFTRRFPSRRQRQRVIMAGLALILLLGCMPLGLISYFTYANAKAVALDGARHLENIQAKLPTSDLTGALNQQTLDGIKPDILAAQKDFAQLADELDNSPVIGMAGITPGISGKILAARRLAHIGLDITKLASLLVDSGSSLVTILHNSPLSATQPVITLPDLLKFNNTLNSSEALINDMAAQAQGVSFASLLSPSQSALLGKFLNGLPQIHQTFGTLRQFMLIAPTLFSLGKPTNYLIVTMDRSELRASGGFQGNYAVAAIEDGRLIDPLKLNDVYNVDKRNSGCWNPASTAPAQYQNWWPFACWGLRDANLSADFPTSAKYAMRLYQSESGAPVSGVIALTPTLIQQLLHITGPIPMPDFGVTVNESNIETVIHQFQLTHQGISQQGDLPPDDTLSSVRKRFTANLGKVLQERLHGMPQSQMITLFKDAIGDLKTKDVQFYSADPAVEQFFTQQNVSGQLLRGAGDGLFVVDSNLSGKQNTYVQEAINDRVQIDASGTATHTLKITYNFSNPKDAPTYGYRGNYYHEYVRVYVPPQSQWIGGNGTLSPTTSDEPQRAMWAGFLDVAMNSGPVTVTLQWRVPQAAASGSVYHYAMQKQAGNHITCALTVTKTGASQPLLSFATASGKYLETDQTFSVIV